MQKLGGGGRGGLTRLNSYGSGGWASPQGLSAWVLCSICSCRGGALHDLRLRPSVVSVPGGFPSQPFGYEQVLLRSHLWRQTCAVPRAKVKLVMFKFMVCCF